MNHYKCLRSHQKCNMYAPRDLLRGISLWQHPVLVLRDVPFLDLQSILEFVYLGEVNVEQDRLQSFLKTAELLRIKGLTDGLPDTGGGGREAEEVRKVVTPKKVEEAAIVVPSLLRPTAKRPSSVTDEILNGVPATPPEKKIKTVATVMETEKEEELIPRTVSEDGDDYDGEIIDYDEDEDDEGDYSQEHIVVAGDAITQQAAEFDDYDEENKLKIVDDLDANGCSPLHKRCIHCNMVMLKKNLSRHIRDQHTEERPRLVKVTIKLLKVLFHKVEYITKIGFIKLIFCAGLSARFARSRTRLRTG